MASNTSSIIQHWAGGKQLFMWLSEVGNKYSVLLGKMTRRRESEHLNDFANKRCGASLTSYSFLFNIYNPYLYLCFFQSKYFA